MGRRGVRPLQNGVFGAFGRGGGLARWAGTCGGWLCGRRPPIQGPGLWADFTEMTGGWPGDQAQGVGWVLYDT